MNSATTTYHNALIKVLNRGVKKEDRTGTGTISTFGEQLRFGLEKEFPLIESKKVFFKGILEELLWFIRGDTNNNSLVEKGVNFWTPWAADNGDLGPVYGKMWRSWPTTSGETIDQLREAQRLLREEPDSRRIIVNAWNPEFLPDPSVPPKTNPEKGRQALPPCHMMFQFQASPLSVAEMLGYCASNGIPLNLGVLTDTFMDVNGTDPSIFGVPDYVKNKRKLNLQVYIRSNDMFLGAPFNIASYALLVMMMAQCCDMLLGDLVYTIGDCHIYNNHIEQVKEQINRWSDVSASRVKTNPVWVEINPEIKDIDQFSSEDFTLVNYDPLPAIKGAPAV